MKFFTKISLESEQRNILFASFAAISGVGLLSYAALPLLMGSTMDSLSLNERDVGILYSLEFIAAAISSLLIAPKTGKVRRRDLAYAGAIIVILGNLASAWWCTYEFLLVIRPMTGIGAGIALACGNATIANAKQPEKIAGMMNVMFAGMLLLLMVLLTFLSGTWGLQGVFLGLVLTTLIFFFMLIRMPQRAIKSDSALSAAKTDNRAIFSIAGIAIFAVFFMFTLRDSMAWAFTERIGTELGYTLAEMGAFLSVGGFIGLLGPVLVTIIGFKFGVKLPLLIGLALAGLTTYSVFSSVETPYLFEIAVLSFTATYFFAISYLTAYAATLDPDGRIVAASGSAMVLGVAAGPALAGHLIESGGYALGAQATLVLILVAILGAMVSLKWSLKPRKIEPNAPELTTNNG